MDVNDLQVEALIMHHTQLFAEYKKTKKRIGNWETPRNWKRLCCRTFTNSARLFSTGKATAKWWVYALWACLFHQTLQTSISKVRKNIRQNFSDWFYEPILIWTWIEAEKCREDLIITATKVVSSYKKICSWSSVDSTDDYERISESNAILLPKHFCDTIVNKFEELYLRLLTTAYPKRIESRFYFIDFPGFFGCLAFPDGHARVVRRSFPIFCWKGRKPFVKMRVI